MSSAPAWVIDAIDQLGLTAENAAKTFSVNNPATDTPIVELADADTAEGRSALAAAQGAAEAWAATSARYRADILMRTFTLMMQRQEELAELICLENGKAKADAMGEVAYAAEYFRWYAEESVRIRGESFRNPAGSNQVLVSYEPIGVSLLVTPWNFPAAMATRKIGPALAAGCTVILKPAAETPLTAIAVAQILEESGVPRGVVNLVVTTQARQIVADLIETGEIPMLSFTGSTEVGRVLQRQMSDSVGRTAMELGGNAPFIVLGDANVDDALEGAFLAKMRNGGQACTAANRFYAEEGIYDEFVNGLVDKLSGLKVGDPLREASELGPLITHEAVAKCQELVDDAVDRGAVVALGGKAIQGRGSYFEPTVLKDVPADARIMHEEVFGPVAPVARFSDVDEVIGEANNTIHGLVSYLYTQDISRGMRVSGKLEAGMIALNRGIVSDPSAPFGGVKQSGIGREGSHEGLHEYLETKYIATAWS